MMGFFSNLFAKQNCAVCGSECGTLHRSKLRDGQFLCDDCGNKCSKYIRLSELTLDEAKEHMEYMARMKRVFYEAALHKPVPRQRIPLHPDANGAGVLR